MAVRKAAVKLVKSTAKPGVKLVTRKPRLLYIVHNHPALAPGGSEIFAHRAFRHLRDVEKREIFFVAACGNQYQPRHDGSAFMTLGGEQAADEFLFHADAFDYFMQSSRQLSALAQEFAGLLRELQPEIVHIHHTLRFGMEVLPLIKTTLPNAKIVYTLHDFVPICHRDGQMLRTIQNTLCDRASPSRCHQCFPEISPERFMVREQFIKQHLGYVDRFISPSHFLAKRYVQWGIAPEKISVIANGRVNEMVSPRKAKSCNRFAFFGQITPYKGVIELIEAAAFLRDAPVRIDIHGSISQQTEAFQQRFHAALEAAPDMVRYHGAYTPAQLPALMEETDWVLVPSIWWENAPLVIDEAFAFGKPVICSGIGGMAEKVTHGVNGLHVPPGQPQKLAEVMAHAAKDAAGYQKLQKNIALPCSLAESMAQHQELYETL